MRKPEHRKVPENHLRCAEAFAGVDAGIAVSVALPVAPKYQDGKLLQRLPSTGVQTREEEARWTVEVELTELLFNNQKKLKQWGIYHDQKSKICLLLSERRRT